MVQPLKQTVTSSPAVCSKTFDTWEKCGGGDKDVPWDKTCCKHGDVCTRKDSKYWRCEPADVNYNDNGGFTWMLSEQVVLLYEENAQHWIVHLFLQLLLTC
jgi:hypothetical protein